MPPQWSRGAPRELSRGASEATERRLYTYFIIAEMLARPGVVEPSARTSVRNSSLSISP